MKKFGTICFMVFLIITFAITFTFMPGIFLDSENVQKITEVEKELITPSVASETTTAEEKCTKEQLNILMIKDEIYRQAMEYNIDVDIALQIADCESNFDIYAKNPTSSAKGIFQFTDSTWEWINASNHQYDYKENIRQFCIWYSKFPQWWEQCLLKQYE